MKIHAEVEMSEKGKKSIKKPIVFVFIEVESSSISCGLLLRKQETRLTQR